MTVQLLSIIKVITETGMRCVSAENGVLMENTTNTVSSFGKASVTPRHVK